MHYKTRIASITIIIMLRIFGTNNLSLNQDKAIDLCELEVVVGFLIATRCGVLWAGTT
jgi:hypothetical protein